VVCRPPPMTVMSGSVTGMGTRQPVVSVGEAVAAAGRGLVGQEAGADGIFELLMCFVFFFLTCQWLVYHQLVDGFFFNFSHEVLLSQKKNNKRKLLRFFLIELHMG
jgi:hypothetical protein